MTEPEWQTCTVPDGMVLQLAGIGSDRKWLLFLMACCRRTGHLLSAEYGWKLVETVERFAEHEASLDELRKAWDSNPSHELGLGDQVVQMASDIFVSHSPWDSDPLTRPVTSALSIVRLNDDLHPDPTRQVIEQRTQCDLLREVFGNPFKLQVVNDAWLTWNDNTIPRLAQAMYEDRNFSRLPVLADALEEAGCTDAELLNHCRQPGPHIRGCWAVDLLLGKQ